MTYIPIGLDRPCKGCSYAKPGIHCQTKDMNVGKVADCPCVNCLVKSMCTDKLGCEPKEKMILSAMEELWKTDEWKDIINSIIKE
jgi:hypothetical protein